MKVFAKILMGLMFTHMNSAFSADDVNTRQLVANDGEVAQVMLTVDKGEVGLAKKAIYKLQDPVTREFAYMMINEHTEHIKETKKIAKQNNIVPKENELSKSLQSTSKNAMRTLDASTSAGVDLTYIELQVTMHQKALDLLNNVLIPKTTNGNFKTHLEKTRAVVSTHLDKARVILSSLQQKLPTIEVDDAGLEE